MLSIVSRLSEGIKLSKKLKKDPLLDYQYELT